MNTESVSDVLSKFNSIYEEVCDEKNFNINDKPCFKEVYDTLKKFDMPTLPFQINLKSLKLLCSDDLENDMNGVYLSKANKIIYRDDSYLKHELFHAASGSRKDTPGIVLKNRDGAYLGTGLNEGITDMFSKLSNEDEPVSYPFEKFCAEALMFMYGMEIFVPYFKNEPVMFVRQFDQMPMLELMDNLDKYSASICNVFKSLEDGNVPNPNDVVKTAMTFNKTLEKLAILYHKSDLTDVECFKNFISNGLYSEEMAVVMSIVTRFGLDEEEAYQNHFR